MRPHVAALMSASALALSPLGAQQSPGDLHPPRAPISIGNYPNVNGLRFNFRDDHLERVSGVNVTVWSAYPPAAGVVRGMALGLPVTDAGSIEGFGTGLFGVGASDQLRGVFLAPVGAGAGGRVRGIVIGGVGAGAGGDLDGLFLGGVGAGAGGNARGFLAGGVGAGAGGSMKGIAIGGVGVGAGGDVTGIAIGGVGTGAGGRLTGFALGGVGVGAGDRIHGVAIGGVGVGAPRLDGAFAGLAVGGRDVHALVIAPAYFKIEREGSFRGASLSAVNDVRGALSGLTLGVVNYARTVHGVQIGLINVIAEQSAHPFLPLINWGAR